MTECLSWRRWVFNRELDEIFEYYENMQLTHDDILENC